jgi:amino acid adenylation domain-containing protein
MRIHLAQQYLESAALQRLGEVAVTDGRTKLTFGELATASDHLACFLVAVGVSRGDRIVYFLKRSPDCVTATLGILKTGAAYVPVDPKTPAERFQRIVQDAAPRIILCDGTTLAETLDLVATLAAPPQVACLSARAAHVGAGRGVFFREEIEAATGTSLQPEGSLDDVAYVLYTSGSTGFPKGVMVTHGNIRNYIDWAISYFGITAQDRILGTAPFHFDMSTFDIFSSLAAGATFCVATEEHLLFPENLVRFIEGEGITIWKAVSSLLMYLCRAGVVRPGRMPSLRTVIFAGEALHPQYLAMWMECLPEKKYFNAYGPTEATGISLCHQVNHVPDSDQPIPIGRPCKGASIAVVGENGLPVGPGEIGELCIAGPGIAKGYLNDPEKTQRHFAASLPGCALGERVYWTGDLVRQTPDGDYVFVSRKDHQVKWMGYRIELAEIETNLLAHPQVKDAAVLLASSGNDELAELVAFFEAEGTVGFSELTQFLQKRIPPYMIPKRYIRMDSFPRNDRGKVAREEILRRYSADQRKCDVGV